MSKLNDAALSPDGPLADEPLAAALPGGPRVRPLRPDAAADAALLRALFARTVSVGHPAWYTPAQLAARQRESADALLARLGRADAEHGQRAGPVPGTAPPTAAGNGSASRTTWSEAVFVAELADVRAGFAWVTCQQDHFTRQPTGHLEDLATAPGCEGRGVGAALVAAVEAWARAESLAALTLNVWPANVRARALYARLGFVDEMVRMKRLL